MDIQACIRCGSRELHMPGVRDGALVGTGDELGRWACNRCGLNAAPLLFDDEESWRAYEAERAKAHAKDWPSTGWPALKRP